MGRNGLGRKAYNPTCPQASVGFQTRPKPKLSLTDRQGEAVVGAEQLFRSDFKMLGPMDAWCRLGAGWRGLEIRAESGPCIPKGAINRARLFTIRL